MANKAKDKAKDKASRPATTTMKKANLQKADIEAAEAAEAAALLVVVNAEVENRCKCEHRFKDAVTFHANKCDAATTKLERLEVITQLYRIVNSDLPTIYHKNPDIWFRMVVAFHTNSTSLLNEFESHLYPGSEPIITQCHDELRNAKTNMYRLIKHHMGPHRW